MALRWILGARASMQRIGFLYFVCKNAAKDRTTSRDTLATKLLEELRTLVPVPTDRRDDIIAHLERLKSSGSRSRYSADFSSLERIEYQDLLLVDRQLPSSTGAATSETAVDFVDEAIDWGLLRPESFTLTDRGTIMLYIWKRWSNLNPLLLSRPLQHACCYWYLETDSDALRAGYGALQSNDFTRLELGEAIGDGLNLLVGSSQLDSIARAKRTRLRALLKAIKGPAGKSSGSGRATYQQATLRAEHCVDLGLVNKNDRYAYSYTVPKSSLVAHLPEKFDDFLETRFIGSFFGCDPAETVAGYNWKYILEAYSLLRNSLKYSSYNETVLLAQVIAASDGVLVNLDTLREEITRVPNTYNVRLGLGRNGKPQFLKVENA